MSILIKGIDTPQKLYTDIRIYKDGRIKKIIGENIMISYNKNAEAIQIPKDHGRLIDESKMYTPFTTAPTILESEEEE